MGRLRRACLTSLFIVLLPVPLLAQLSVGVRAGLSLGDQEVDAVTGPEEVSVRAGVVAGLTMGYAINSHMQLAWGGRLAQKGGTQAQQAGAHALLRTTYLEMPISIRLLPSAEGRVRPFLSAGGFLAFETGCNLRMEGGGQTLDVGCGEAADRKKTDIGGLLSAGSEVDLGRVALTLEAEYAVGLRDISHTQSATVKTRTILLTAGLSYALGGGSGGR